jgi:hypothetical protein
LAYVDKAHKSKKEDFVSSKITQNSLFLLSQIVDYGKAVAERDLETDRTKEVLLYELGELQNMSRWILLRYHDALTAKRIAAGFEYDELTNQLLSFETFMDKEWKSSREKLEKRSVGSASV